MVLGGGEGRGQITKVTRKLAEIIKRLRMLSKTNCCIINFQIDCLILFIDDISFQEARFGHFNLFNAFLII